MKATRSSLRRLHWALLLPVFLLLTQQGLVRHELGHLVTQMSGTQKSITQRSSTQNASTQAEGTQNKAPGGAESCDLCLAFSHLGNAAKPEVVALALVDELRFHQVQGQLLGSTEPERLTARNRGPPIL